MSAPEAGILVLGGTAEAMAAATELAASGHRVVLSLLGLTDTTAGEGVLLRTGGFGGPAGLADELRAGGHRLLLDGSHPFASSMVANAAAAAEQAQVPRLRLLRPSWTAGPADRWSEVASLAEAADTLHRRHRDKRVLLTVGRAGAEAFSRVRGVHLILRTLPGSPPPLTPPGTTIIAGRGPFDVADERQLLRDHRIDLLVTRNSGGAATDAKLAAARELTLPVLMIRRPDQPPGDRVSDVAGALAWVAERS